MGKVVRFRTGSDVIYRWNMGRHMGTAISRNVVGKKQKTAQANPERYFGIRSMNFNKSIDTCYGLPVRLPYIVITCARMD